MEPVNHQGKLNFHDLKMPTEINPDMFKYLSRVMPSPVLDYETIFLEPITSVFADFQTEYERQHR